MSKVEVRKSTIPNAGNGVFATEDIKKGEKICYYDGVDVEAHTVNICETDMSYALTKDKEHKYTRLGNPLKTTAYNVGQFCNDSCCPIITDINYPSVKKAFDEYLIKTKSLLNIVRENYDDFHMVALKDIKKGEEIFYSYGVGYWLIHFLKISTDSFLRLILYSLLTQFETNEFTDEQALYIFENVMNHDLNNSFWIDTFKKNSPKNYLLRIMKQLKIIN
jgi:SET domain-containing protein